MGHSRPRFNGPPTAPRSARPRPSGSSRAPFERVIKLPPANATEIEAARARLAQALLFSPGMNTVTNCWRRLSAETIAALPQASAVFEVANLVRNVHFIGAANGNLRARLAAFTQEHMKLIPTPGGYYVRYEKAEREDEALALRLDSYRAVHGGRVPMGNRERSAEGRPALRIHSRRAA